MECQGKRFFAQEEVPQNSGTMIEDGSTNTAFVILYIDVLDEDDDPLIIDLDGDGIELIDNSNAHFDLDLDGVAENTAGWVSGDDAFLAFDWNKDGIINDKTELFGDNAGYAHGFENLAAYDDNKDGLINLGDGIFGNLLLWQDKNGDGFSDGNEISSIMDHGISFIDLGYKFVDNIINNQWESHRSTFTFDDGTEGQISNIWFR